MDRQYGQRGSAQAWNHASAVGKTQPPPEAGGLKPLAPIRPLAIYPSNEPYGPYSQPPAPIRPLAVYPPNEPYGPHGQPPAPIRPLAIYPSNEAYGPHGQPPAPTRPRQGGPYPTPAAAWPGPPDAQAAYAGQAAPPQQGAYPPRDMQPAWPDPRAAQAAGFYGNPAAPQNAPGSVPPYNTPIQHADTGRPAAAQGVTPPPTGDAFQPPDHPAAPWQQPDARPVWLPPSVSPLSEPTRRTLLQTVPQTAPQPYPDARQPEAMPGEPAEAVRRRRAAPAAGDPAPEPNHPAAPPEEAVWQGWQPDEAGEPYEPNDDPSDEDSGQFYALEQKVLPEPLPVPTYGYRLPRRGGGRRIARTVLLVLAVMATVLAALYFTGALKNMLAALRPASGSVPSVFVQPLAGGGVAPAAQATVPELRSLSVAPASAVAPATLVFTLTTNAATSAIRLLMADGSALRTTASATPQGDGLLWLATAYVEVPSAGTVRVYLRDEAGVWSAAALTCDIAVG